MVYGRGSRVGIFAGKKYFCHLPALTELNRQKVAEMAKMKMIHWLTLHASYFTLQPLNTSIHNMLYHQANLTADMPPNVPYHWTLSAFSLVITSGPERQPTYDGKHNNFWQKSGFKCINLFIYMSGLVLNKNKKALHDEVDVIFATFSTTCFASQF